LKLLWELGQFISLSDQSSFGSMNGDSVPIPTRLESVVCEHLPDSNKRVVVKCQGDAVTFESGLS
jgi:hypothetical protein